MSRSDYSDCLEHWDLIRWRGAVASATKGKRGQKMLRDLLAALDAMPAKRLIGGDLVDDAGDVCVLGALAKARKFPDLDTLDSTEHEVMAERFDVAEALIRELEAMNDEWGPWHETPEHRWRYMRGWVAKQIRAPS